MKNTNTAKKETSQLNENNVNKNQSSHIKIVKPRPNGTDVAVQGPRDCFPLG